MADYIEDYIVHFNLPHKMNTMVTGIEKVNNYFYVFTTGGNLQSRKVIVASGAFLKKLYTTRNP
ncbi:NAD(P)-binding domain-containing protein [Lentibacillus sp. Marseille-P4043]|uniref:NAD(P)-binding domain-containing protein n=1 Tax=Lentibacillus sp. Marseille-P4043 TaxID=2040293 RepID=UPI001F23E850|nr:NAD(P)-binding domain-containing protein [Lentibacillus sp. Marseille-P4043]